MARRTDCDDIGRGCVGSGVWWEWVERPYRSEPVRSIGDECDVFWNGDEYCDRNNDRRRHRNDWEYGGDEQCGRDIQFVGDNVWEAECFSGRLRVLHSRVGRIDDRGDDHQSRDHSSRRWV